MTEDKKKDRQKDLEQLSPGELKKEIEKKKKKAAQNFVFALAAAVALVAVCIAWFVNNTRVSAGLGTISAKYSGIEIGSKGAGGVHDDFLQEVKNGITYHLSGVNSDKKHDTSQGASINWLLGSDSNMNNYDAGKTFEDTKKEFRKDYAMEPGTKGKLDFFIKSYDEGDLSLKFSLDIVPYQTTSTGTTSTTNSTNTTTPTDTTTSAAVVKDSDSVGLLSGHILYFLGEKQNSNTGANSIKYTWIKDGTFTIKIPNAQKDTEYEYSIYWVWPLNLSTILLNTGDEFLNGSTIEFDDKDNTGGLRNEIVEDMKAKPEKYFFSSLTGGPLDENYAEVKEIEKIHACSGKTSESDETYDKQLFVDLSSYYNQADMKIGGAISFITATLEYLGKTETTAETSN